MSAMPQHPILADIRAARPGLRLLTEPAATLDYRRDETDFIPFGQPLAVAFPTTTEDVSAVVRACARHRVPVVARGGGSGLSGGALIMVTGAPDDSDLAVFRLLSRDYVKTVAMAVAQKENEGILQLRRAGAITVLSAAGAPWAPVWREAMERAWSTATAG